MALSEQADEITRSINDYREQIADVAAQHAHVERLLFEEGRILAAQTNWADIFAEKLNLALHDDRGSRTTYAAEAI